MRTVVHISDIHFGSVNPAIIRPLIQQINDIRPNVIAVSGDLTQRARSEQFAEARRFLDQLPTPQIVVPGNHDIPLFNIFDRFFKPLEKYRRYISGDLDPSYFDNEIVVLGVNTARSLTIKGGRINKQQVAWLRDQFCVVAPSVIKMVVTHHPFGVATGHDKTHLVGRVQMALRELGGCGADLFVSGHLHTGQTGHTAKFYKVDGITSLVVHAGTAASTRIRGETNSFNVIRTAQNEIQIERWVWQATEERFVDSVTDRFIKSEGEWVRVE